MGIRNSCGITARRAASWATLVVLLALAADRSSAQLNWEGQGGVFLNALPFTTAPGRYEASTHYINLDRLGEVTTFSVAAGLRGNVEIGLTRITSGVSGVPSQNVVPVKWFFQTETPTRPAVAATLIARDLVGVGGATDLGLSAAKVVKIGTSTVLLDLGVRSTKVVGNGLFGKASGARIKWEGSAAVFVTKTLILGTEFKEQIGGRTWTDLALRYIASDRVNVDLGVANFGPAINNQVAVGVTVKL